MSIIITPRTWSDQAGKQQKRWVVEDTTAPGRKYEAETSFEAEHVKRRWMAESLLKVGGRR